MELLRLLLDENISVKVAHTLRAEGFDVVSVSELNPGGADEWVIEKAHDESRIIVTQDRDFGMLVYVHKVPHCGVIYLRLENDSPKQIYEVLSALLTTHGSELTNKFSVVSENEVRIR